MSKALDLDAGKTLLQTDGIREHEPQPRERWHGRVDILVEDLELLSRLGFPLFFNQIAPLGF